MQPDIGDKIVTSLKRAIIVLARAACEWLLKRHDRHNRNRLAQNFIQNIRKTC